MYVGCYCNEGKGLSIGTYKTIETVEKISTASLNLNLECDEANEIYYTRDKDSNTSRNEQTYGYIAQNDYEFALWICDNLVYPHANIFCKILRIELDDTVRLDNIIPMKLLTRTILVVTFQDLRKQM
jgi:hypothetical protein